MKYVLPKYLSEVRLTCVRVSCIPRASVSHNTRISFGSLKFGYPYVSKQHGMVHVALHACGQALAKFSSSNILADGDTGSIFAESPSEVI